MPRPLALLAVCALLAACVRDEDPGETAANPTLDSAIAAATPGQDSVTDPADEEDMATATLRDSAGTEVGTVTLTQVGDGVSVTGGLTGIMPGTHGIHIHAVGRCEPPFESAGPHWNPTSRQHGLENPQGPHLGDLPSVTIDAAGTGSLKGTTRGGSVGRDNALLDADGASIVLHADPDDNRTDPSGNSGRRIACGVIQQARQ